MLYYLCQKDAFNAFVRDSDICSNVIWKILEKDTFVRGSRHDL